MDKLIEFSEHAKLQMVLRGAEENEIITAIRSGKWKPAKRGKWRSKFEFTFNKKSPVNQKFYKSKTVDIIFADERDKIVVVTVKVYYHN